MAQKRNYLLGYGERLTTDVKISAGGGEKVPPYSFAEARSRLTPMLKKMTEELVALPEKTCPNDQAVASLTLHPEYYAKSYFPGTLLQHAGLRAVGSRAVKVTPQKRSRDRNPEESVTTEFFIAGPRSSFFRFAEALPNWTPLEYGANQLPAIETVSIFESEQRIRPLRQGEGEIPLEIVLHAGENLHDRFILAGFQDYLEELGIASDMNRMFFAGKLCFLRLLTTELLAHEVAKYSFLRVLREMPGLRTTRPLLRGRLPRPRAFKFPVEGPLDQSVRVAVLDGGVPESSPLIGWVNPVEAPGVGEPDLDLLWHGETVTSALLFGSVSNGQASRPLCRVDHHRILDKKSETDPFELYEVLERVKSVLNQGNYEFINISLGPTLPVDDEEVHAWTAVLDEHLADGRCLISIAAGNTGDQPDDPLLQTRRVQVPSDCVNALTVGASNSLSGTDGRAPYSSKGPGRSPGIVKPDLIAFGGGKDPFWVSDPDTDGQAIATAGTSYAAPAAMRAGVAARTQFGSVLTPLAIKALLVHSTVNGGYSQEDVGWGILPNNLDELVVCPDGCVRVVYQDEITASQYRRIRIPLPPNELTGKVYITATFCYATQVDPEHPGNYTKSGLSVVFRPDKAKFSRDEAVHADSAAFFQPAKLYNTEQNLRTDAHKWETCLHRRVGKLAKSLNEPVLDIHYNARSEGRGDSSAEKIRYALIVTVEAPKVKDLYDRVVREYRTQLQPLTPVIDIPIQPTL